MTYPNYTPAGWWSMSTPDNFKPIPWLHPSVTMYLESLLRPDMHVIEHGCGGSTLWFAERVASVTAIDNNKEWIKAVMERATGKQIAIHESDKIPSGMPLADLLMIDGAHLSRPKWIMNAAALVKPGGIVVVDNYTDPYYSVAVDVLKRAVQCHITFNAPMKWNQHANTLIARTRDGVQVWI